ncbi:MAG: BPTI/Kunitz-type proteinase inhibitor domain-containing protein [Flavobacteriales bacterium]|nr:BPTI/Kunitz-type proteinase inhibitor domain-containing protein [Flavobacteriales bacterium]
MFQLFIMQVINWGFLLIICLLLSSCSYCPSSRGACAEQVPQGETCMAYFERWFFDEETNTCIKISYSGCSSKGFETQQACNACKCK